MLTITDGATLARAMHSTAGPHVRRLLALRRSQLGDDWHEAADFHVAEAGDTVADAKHAIGFPLTVDGEPTCDWVAHHEGVTEVAFVLSDEGPAQVLIVPHLPDIDAELLAFAHRVADADTASASRA